MIWLIARREIVVRSRDKSLWISTGITVAILAAIILLPKLFGSTDTIRVAVSDPAVVESAQQLEDAFGVQVEALEVADDAAAEAAVRDERADAAVAGDRLVLSGSADDNVLPLLQEASRLDRASAPDPPPLEVQQLDSDAQEKQAFATVALIILYTQLIGYGFLVATGVVEEKASRIVEILLATVRARDLLFGKVLGIGTVALGQLLLVVVCGLVIGGASGAVDIGGDEIATLPTVLGWFLLGYALYAGAFALAGSLVSRQEDIQSVTTPMLFVLIASFFLGFQAVDDPGGSVAAVLSYVPVSSPLVMPVRMIAGEVGVGEVLIAIAIVVATTYAVIAFAARLYGSAVLQTGGRVRLKQLTSGRTGAP